MICDLNITLIHIIGDAHLPVEPVHQQSAWAELSGLYGLATFAFVMLKLESKGTFRVGCDSLEAIRKLHLQCQLTAATPDYDIAHSV